MKELIEMDSVMNFSNIFKKYSDLSYFQNTI